MTISKTLGGCLLVVGLLASTASALNMETVPVGNAGNAADTTGYGSVGYSYNIGKYEVTAGQYSEFLNAVAKTDTYGLYNPYMDNSVYPGYLGCNIKRAGTNGNYQYSVAAEWANRPVNYVNWGDAARFANWLHNGQPTGQQGFGTTEDGAYYLNGATSRTALLAVNRETTWKWAVTSENEWYKAAYHKNDGVTGNYFDYATSSDSVPVNILNPNGTNNVNYYDLHGTGTGGYTIGSPYYRTEVGAFANSASPYGTYDQNGNVSEWNESVIGSVRGRRGSALDSFSEYLIASFRDSFDPSLDGNSIGFRVVEVPEPGTMTLLALGGLALIRRKRQ